MVVTTLDVINLVSPVHTPGILKCVSFHFRQENVGAFVCTTYQKFLWAVEDYVPISLISLAMVGLVLLLICRYRYIRRRQFNSTWPSDGKLSDGLLESETGGSTLNTGRTAWHEPLIDWGNRMRMKMK